MPAITCAGAAMTWTLPSLAVAYARRGWAVFPLHSPGDGPSGCDCGRRCGRDAAKHPRTTHGLLDATTEPLVVARWWEQHQNANIAIATGARSGLVVLDVDPRSGGEASLAAMTERHGALPETACVATGGGGLHYYFAHPGVQVGNSAGKFGLGLDVRGDGGYVVAPPSVHVSGSAYTWLVACEPVPMPEWLAKRPAHMGAGPPRLSVEQILAGVPEGQRDDALFRLAAKLRGADVPRSVTEELVLRAAANCSPPYPPNDAMKKVEGAYARYRPNASAATPRSRPRLVNRR